jgi:SAM-dependent methyltransferase
MALTPRQRRHAAVGPPRLWRSKREFQLRFLKEHGLAPSHYLLDLGCGTLRGGIPIIDYLEAGHYYGVDIKSEAIAEARKELRRERLVAKDPQLFVAPDVSTFSADVRFDFIWAFSVFIHMRDPILDGALGVVARHLRDDGECYGNVNAGERRTKGSNRSKTGYPVVWRSLEFYEEACARHGLEVAELGALSEFGHEHPGKKPEAQARERMLRIRKAPPEPAAAEAPS